MLEWSYKQEKHRLVLTIEQDLKSTTVGAAHAWLLEEWPAHSSGVLKQVYLDVRNARVIDSTGVNWILLLVRCCEAVKVPLTIQVASPAAMRVFKFAGLDKLATIKFRRRQQL